ncbi:hypothetical protein, partial [Streptomyces albus]|uniref:hypothetical protein n=1 Tax=Streptomyces albus TaxID=1888 RepID=UPI00156DE1F9
LAAEHGLPEAWAAALLTGRAPEHLDADGVRAAAAAVVWALTERPVGDPAAAGARTLIDHLGDAPAGLLAGLRRLADRSATTPVPPGQYETNPLFSVPDLVAEVATALGAGRDAAALHLQLHALGRPSDRTVRRWNMWTPEHHRTVRKELTAAKAPRPAPVRTGLRHRHRTRRQCCLTSRFRFRPRSRCLSTSGSSGRGGRGPGPGHDVTGPLLPKRTCPAGPDRSGSAGVRPLRLR